MTALRRYRSDTQRLEESLTPEVKERVEGIRSTLRLLAGDYKATGEDERVAREMIDEAAYGLINQECRKRKELGVVWVAKLCRYYESERKKEEQPKQ